MCFTRGGVRCNLSRCRFARGAPNELDISSTLREQTLQLARKGNRNSVFKNQWMFFKNPIFPAFFCPRFCKGFFWEVVERNGKDELEPQLIFLESE